MRKTVRKSFTNFLAFLFGLCFIGVITCMLTFQSANVSIVLAADQAAEGSWQGSGNGWWYQYQNGAWATGWQKIGDTWYFFDNSGWMQTGWLNTGNSWYYLQPSGAMTEGWANLNNTWYYLTPGNGAMQTGWFTDFSGTWYYAGASGAMQTGWLNTGNSWYYLQSSGAMAEGWILLGGTWYYLTPGNGAMQTGWFTDPSGTWYYSDSSGAMISNRWIGDYYVGSSGTMAVNCWIGNYYVGADGKWLPGGPNTHVHNWTWSTEVENVKSGYACNTCYRDVSDWDDPSSCCGGWHTHQWYLMPTYSTCESCDMKKHEHEWYYVEPNYIMGTDEVYDKGYWICWRCGNQSKDGKTMEPISVSDKGFKYGAINKWLTPYDFSADGSNKWILVDASWEQPAPPSLQRIDIRGNIALAPGDKGEYQIIFTPASAVENITFKSSDPSVISIDNAGKYTAHKSGTAKITAKSTSGYEDSVFVRVTSPNIGVVKNATLLVNGKSAPDSVITLSGNYKTYTVTLQTYPDQAVYEVYYSTENKVYDTEYSSYTDCVWFSGQIMTGTTDWEKGPSFTDPETKITTGRTGTATIVAKVIDTNGNVTVLKQPVRIK